MENKEDDFCVALRLPGCPKRSEAEAAVRRALGAHRGIVMEIELFPGRRESLVLAHPAGEEVYITKNALCCLAMLYGEE